MQMRIFNLHRIVGGRILIDYIHYQSNRVRVLSVFEPMQSSHIIADALPQLNYGSDHTAIAARVQYI